MTFREKVYKKVAEIPLGYVATYGKIAAMVGHPRAARQVGGALAVLGVDEIDVPWWRVVNREGYLSINQGGAGLEKKIQKDLLEKEGVEVSKEFVVDLGKYIWIRI